MGRKNCHFSHAVHRIRLGQVIGAMTTTKAISNLARYSIVLMTITRCKSHDLIEVVAGLISHDVGLGVVDS